MGLRISLFKGEYLRDKDDLRDKDQEKNKDKNNEGLKDEVQGTRLV